MSGLLAAVLLLQAAVPVTSVAQGANSGIMEPRQAVVRTGDAWQALWKEHRVAPEAAPAVDFSRFMVVGVFLGTRPNAGFSVEITGATVVGSDLVVEYVERRPPPDALTAQVLTSPFHIVRVPRAAGKVDFRRR